MQIKTLSIVSITIWCPIFTVVKNMQQNMKETVWLVLHYVKCRNFT